MRFDVSAASEMEPKDFDLLQPGAYQFEVIDAVAQVAQSGNDMITLTLTVWDKSGKTFRVWDRLVATPKALFRVKNFCEAGGLLEKYTAGTLLPENCQGVSGNVQIKIDPATDKYKAKNVVVYYITNEEPAKAEKKLSAPPADDFEQDDIPF